MRFLLPKKTIPLSYYYVHGTMCCHRMYTQYTKNQLIDFNFCYEARVLYEANALVIWGSLSKKLAELVASQIDFLSSKRYLLHIRGCDLRVDNQQSSSSLSNILPISAVVSDCNLNKKDYERLIFEARQCLQA